MIFINYYFKEAAIKNLHRWIVFKLNEKGAHIDGLFYSTYHPNSKKKFTNKEKNLRKPNTGMLEVAFNKWNILIKGSLVIGDNQTDIMMAQKADINSYLVKKKTNLLNVVKKFHKEKLL
jgi:D-glycero-D-manno-heptose 1,7-bisphosphate phosphatase